MSLRPLQPPLPFMNEWEILALETCLRQFSRPLKVLEWGSGHSTVYFAAQLPAGSQWTAIEHNAEWAGQVSGQIVRFGLTEVTVHLVPNNGPFRDGVDDGDRSSFGNYIDFPRSLGGTFDVVFVDGRARADCLAEGWQLLNPDGVMILHDAQRREYAPGIPAMSEQVRLVNTAVISEGPVSMLFMFRGSLAADQLKHTLQDRVPPTVTLTRTSPALRAVPAVPAPAANGKAAQPVVPTPAPRSSPPAASYRCVFVNTYYPDFIKAHYATRPELSQAPYADQLRSLQSGRFGDSDFYSQGLGLAGWDTADLIVNCAPLQSAWARENGVNVSGLEIALEQIRRLQPDVVYLHDLHMVTEALVEALRPHTRLLVGQIASKLPPQAPLARFDVLVSSFPHYVQRFRAQGLTTYYQPLAFEPRLLAELPNTDRPYPLTFVGGLAGAHTWVAGTALLETLAQQTPIEFWGYGLEAVAAGSPIRSRHHGQAWGLEMFTLLNQSLITFNRHGEVAENFANNMRLFEATGCGALLITDHKDNLADLFDIGREIVAYRSPEEALALVKYYLAHPDEARAIAQAGQARTLREHTYAQRLAYTAEFLERHLRASEASRAPAEPAPAGVSQNYEPIAPTDISPELTHGWQSDLIPARQRRLVQAELAQMYRGQVPVPYRVLAEGLAPYITPGSRVVELGCASGYYSEVLEYLLNVRLGYTGVDYSPALIALARQHYPQARFVVADGARLPFEDRHFDVAVSGGILLHVPNAAEHVAETARIARRYVVAHRTPICRRRPTQHYRKLAYGVATVELRFNEAEFVDTFTAQGLVLTQTLQYQAAAQKDEYDVTYVFRRR